MVALFGDCYAVLFLWIKIAAKEADETQYWLTLCELAPGYPGCEQLTSKLLEVQKILNAILGTAKRKTLLAIF
jgi:four helix bundle protein